MLNTARQIIEEVVPNTEARMSTSSLHKKAEGASMLRSRLVSQPESTLTALNPPYTAHSHLAGST